VLPSYQRLLRRVKAQWRGTPLAEACVTHSTDGVKVTSKNIDGDSKVKEIRWTGVVEVVALQARLFFSRPNVCGTCRT
jgi:hypothetical protein